MSGTRGSKTVTDATNTGRPSAEELGIDIPKYLKGDLRAEYIRIVETLHAAGRLHRSDPRLIEAYAIQYGVLISCHQVLEREGLILVTASGTAQMNPVVRVMNASTVRMASLSQRLGLSERGGVGTVVQADPANEWDGLLAMRA